MSVPEPQGIQRKVAGELKDALSKSQASEKEWRARLSADAERMAKMEANLEKVLAQVTPKVVHDLSVFLPKVESAILGEALKKCFAFRETEKPESFSETIKAIKTTSLQRGWTTATTTVPKKRDFKETFDDVVKSMGHLEQSFK